MLKLLVSSTVALFMLAAPALADPQPVPAATVKVAVSIKAGPDTRTHDLAISEDGCGYVKEKSTTYEDDIKLCSRPAANGLRIEAEWYTRTGQNEYRNQSVIVMPHKGSAEIGRAGGTRLVLKLG